MADYKLYGRPRGSRKGTHDSYQYVIQAPTSRKALKLSRRHAKIAYITITRAIRVKGKKRGR